MQEATGPRPRRHYAEIDGLRGIAILAVVALHWIVQPFRAHVTRMGLTDILNLLAYGVDLFFVISGFLIGGILLKAAKTPSGIAAFYIRRVLRIWPLYYLLLGSVYFLGGGPAVFGEIPGWSLAAFMFNFWESIGVGIHRAYGTLWSLAIEEQFYLFAPLLFFLLARRHLMYLAALCLIASPILRLALSGRIDLWRFTPTRLDGISMGVLLALLLESREITQFLLVRIKLVRVMTFSSLVLIVLCRAVLPNSVWDFMGTSLVTLSFGLLVTTAVLYSSSDQKSRILSWSVLRYLGLRCYSIYLFHISFLMMAMVFSDNYWGRMAAQIALTVGFAHLAWEYIELPLMRYGRRFSY